jgi:hypothetical protein
LHIAPLPTALTIGVTPCWHMNKCFAIMSFGKLH